MSLGDDQNNSDGDVDDVGPYCYYTSSFEGCKVGMDVFWSQFVQHVALRVWGGYYIAVCIYCRRTRLSRGESEVAVLEPQSH